MISSFHTLSNKNSCLKIYMKTFGPKGKICCVGKCKYSGFNNVYLNYANDMQQTYYNHYTIIFLP